MAVEILMPELGESVHEGTVSRWIKKIGDFVKEDEPVVEIMTDKVNTELPAPASGILVKINIPEGSEVQVFHSMGVIEEDEAVAKQMLANGVSASSASSAAEPAQTPATPSPVVAASSPAVPAAPNGTAKKWYSPVVRAMAKEHGVGEAELAAISGSGESGRVTKKDLVAYLDRRGSGAPTSAPVPEFKSAAPVASGPDQTVTPLTGMRKMIADAMTRSSQVPVVSTLIEIDVTEMVAFRTRNKDAFQAQNGVKLTYTPFFIKALAETLLAFPSLNSSLTDNQVTSFRGVHMGCAVSLGKDGEGGLIVPVIRDVDQKSLIDIARDLEEIAAKARSNSLGVADVQGGTFTITNPGSYGAVLGTPMINAPQAGILGVYGINQRPVIIDGMIAIRSIMNAVLTYDHRLVDGLMAGRFLQAFKQKLESFDFFK